MKNSKLLFTLTATLAAATLWGYEETIDGYTWTYRIVGDGAEIYKGSWSPAISPNPTGSITIPSSLGGKPITSIGSDAFRGCSGLTSVSIPDSVTSIGSYAFPGCSGLTSVTIGNGVKSIGHGAFSYCDGLRKVTFKGAIPDIGEDAFSWCNSLSCIRTEAALPPPMFYEMGITRFEVPAAWAGYVRSLTDAEVVGIDGCEPVGIAWISDHYYQMSVSAVRAYDGWNDKNDLQVNVSFGEFPLSESETTVFLNIFAQGGGETATNFTFNSAITNGAYLAVVLTDFDFDNCTGYSVAVSNSLFSGIHDFGRKDIPVEADGVAYPGYGSGGWWDEMGGEWHEEVVEATPTPGVMKVDYLYDYADECQYEPGLPGEIGISWDCCLSWTRYILPEGAPGWLYTPTPIDDGESDFYWLISEHSYTFDYYHTWPASEGEEERCASWEDSLFIPPSIILYWASLVPGDNISITIGPYGGYGAFQVCEGDYFASAFEGCLPEGGIHVEFAFPPEDDFYSGDIIARDGYYVRRISLNADAFIEYDRDGNIIATSPTQYDYSGNPLPVFGPVTTDVRYSFFAAPIPYDITFVDELGAANTNATTYTIEDWYDFAPPAEVAGWEFLGWDVSGVYGQNGDITVSAQWRHLDSNVTFDVGAHGSRTGGGELSQTIVWGEAAVPPEIEADINWVFAGWDADISRVTESMTVTALYERSPLPFAKAAGYGGAWTSGGDAEWFTEWTEDAHDGTNHLHSGAIGDGQMSWVETTVSDPGVLSFWWRASSEQYEGDIYDFAFLSVDGEPLGWLDDNYRPQGVAIGGATGWTNVVVEISGDGPHTIRWTYAKDEMDDGDVGEDCAWLDEVSFIPTITLSFGIGEGTGAAPASFQPLPGEVVALPATTGFTRARYTFIGWSDETTTWTAGAQYTVGWTSVAFTAVWAANTLEAPTISSADVADGGVHEAAFATIRIEAEPGASIHYTLDGTEPTAESPRYTAPFAADGMAVIVRAIAVKDDFFDSPVAEFSFTRKPYGAAECLDAAGGAVSTGGEDAPWTRVLGEAAHDGVAAMRSVEIGDNGTSTVAMSVNGAGEVGFWWKVSSEISHNRKLDYVSFMVDGEELSWLGGDKGWTNEVHAVTGGGTHTLKWTYQKNGNGKTMGDDCAWLDEVTWTPAAESCLPQLATNAAPEAVTNAIASAGFAMSVAETLQDAIGGDAEKYNEFKTWAQAVTNGDGEAAGEAAVVASANAAVSWLLGTDTLIANDIESDDVHITGFSIDHGAENDGGEMQFSFEITIDGVEIGSSAAIGQASLKENLRKAIGIEGAARLDGEFSSENIELTVDASVDGKARFTATPPPGAGDSFFIRAKVIP